MIGSGFGTDLPLGPETAVTVLIGAVRGACAGSVYPVLDLNPYDARTGAPETVDV